MNAGDKPSIDDEAIGWFVLLRDESATDDDRRRLEAWLLSNPEHERAWREVERMWGGLDLLAEPRPSAEPTYPAGNVVALHPPRRKAARPSRRAGWRGTAAAAVLATAAFVGWQLTPVGLMADYRSGVGERRIVRLADGSEVELGTATAIDVDVSSETRTVSLLAGEAFFTVAKDPRRPFRVTTNQGDIEVLGTAFNVRIGEEINVAVAHNTVAVSAAGDTGVRVTEGQMVDFGRGGVSAVQPADLEAIEAWRHDQLVFSDVALDRVIAELQRYHHGHIQLLGSDIGARRVTAVFDTRRIDAALDTIAESLDLRIFRVTNLLVGITSR